MDSEPRLSDLGAPEDLVSRAVPTGIPASSCVTVLPGLLSFKKHF